MKTRIYTLLLVGIVSLTCWMTSSATAQDAVVIGCPLPLAASYGQNGLRGITLAVEQINDAGGVKLGDKKVPFKMEVVDTGDLDPKVTQDQAMAKVKSLITDKKAHVLIGGPARSEYGVAAMDVIAENNVVHIVTTGCYTPKWNEGVFAGDPKKYRKSFRMSGNIKWYIKEMKDLLAVLKKDYGFTKMYILIQDVLMCRDAAAIVKKVATADGWEVVGEHAAPTPTTDFQAPLKECKEKGGQLLFLWTYSPNSAKIFEQWREMEIPALPMGFVEAAEDPTFWKRTKGKCAYSVITLSEAGVTISDVTTLSRKFYEDYEERWGVPPRATGSAASYEAVFVLKDAIERAGSVEPDKLIPALEKSDLPVVRGKLRFDETHQCVFGYDPTNSILGNWAQWQNGQRVTIWPQAAKTGDLKMPPWLEWFWKGKK
ncbi:MAG: ABC transporter substrate-binding protein [Phycisphaerae bacterium]|nr:ABC transporter substrate-binding protein [Phycisphaerae bacterium]